MTNGVSYWTCWRASSLEGTQIWIGWGCAAAGSEPMPTSRGNLKNGKKFPFLGNFPKLGTIYRDFVTKTYKSFVMRTPENCEKQTHWCFFFNWIHNELLMQTPTQSGGTSPYALKCENHYRDFKTCIAIWNMPRLSGLRRTTSSCHCVACP